jgi:hypothetical protein
MCGCVWVRAQLQVRRITRQQQTCHTVIRNLWICLVHHRKVHQYSLKVCEMLWNIFRTCWEIELQINHLHAVSINSFFTVFCSTLYSINLIKVIHFKSLSLHVLTNVVIIRWGNCSHLLLLMLVIYKFPLCACVFGLVRCILSCCVLCWV